MYLVNINNHIEVVQTFREARKLCEHVQLENHINSWGYKTLYFQNIANGGVFENNGRWHYIDEGQNYLNAQALRNL